MDEFERFVDDSQERIIEQARALYGNRVVEHWLKPKNPYPLENPDGHAKIKGPCGDTMEIFIHVREGKISNAGFLTDGCITSIASGSMAVHMAIGSGLMEARGISQGDILVHLGGLPVASRHCALLASNTLRAAVDDYLNHLHR
jgi:nitrogen fixation NifU-like protein